MQIMHDIINYFMTVVLTDSCSVVFVLANMAVVVW